MEEKEKKYRKLLTSRKNIRIISRMRIGWRNCRRFISPAQDVFDADSVMQSLKQILKKY